MKQRRSRSRPAKLLAYFQRDERFEQLPCWPVVAKRIGADAELVRGEATVDHHEFRTVHHLRCEVARPRWDVVGEEHRLQMGHVRANGSVRHAQVCRDRLHIQLLRGARRAQPDQRREGIGAIDVGDVAHRTLHNRCRVVLEPLVATRPRSANRFGESASAHSFHVVTARQLAVDAERAWGPECNVHELLAAVAQLTLAERPQVDELDATGEGLGKLRRGEQPGRAGEYESPRRAPTIDAGLDREKQLGNPLDFINDQRSRSVLDIRGWIALRRGPLDWIVECHNLEVSAEELCDEGALARLSRTVDRHNGRVLERGCDGLAGEPVVEKSLLIALYCHFVGIVAATSSTPRLPFRWRAL